MMDESSSLGLLDNVMAALNMTMDEPCMTKGGAVPEPAYESLDAHRSNSVGSVESSQMERALQCNRAPAERAKVQPKVQPTRRSSSSVLLESPREPDRVPLRSAQRIKLDAIIQVDRLNRLSFFCKQHSQPQL